MTSLKTLESGVVFVVVDMIRRIMHALTLHMQLQRLSIVNCATTKKITVATVMVVVGIFNVPAANLRFKMRVP